MSNKFVFTNINTNEEVLSTEGVDLKPLVKVEINLGIPTYNEENRIHTIPVLHKDKIIGNIKYKEVDGKLIEVE